tara:strand:- start:359 stop:565 length:207 start_codon:yes stop_codon:yes gene_type:complete
MSDVYTTAATIMTTMTTISAGVFVYVAAKNLEETTKTCKLLDNMYEDWKRTCRNRANEKERPHPAPER